MALQSVLSNFAREVKGSRTSKCTAAFQLDDPSVLEVRTVSSQGNPIFSRHLLDEVLGNANGDFRPGGQNYSKSARNVKIVKHNLIAELRAFDSTWRSAAIDLRVKQISLVEGLTHELSFGRSRRTTTSERAAPESQDVHSDRQPPAGPRHPRLKGKSLVLVGHYSSTAHDGRFQYLTHHYDLDTRIGNDDGAFTFTGRNFSESARNVRLEGVVLSAELCTISGEWKTDSVPLDWLLDSWCLQSNQVLPADLGPTSQPSQSSLPTLFRSYAPLPPISGQFRLCYVHPGAWDDPVHCTVLSRAMEGAGHYRCLSYVWGSVEDQELIILNSKDKLVTRRLYHALRQLRWHGVTGAVWIDALCINQNDDREKCLQVTQMGNVFANAEQVIVSLGTLDPPRRKPFVWECDPGVDCLPAMLFIFLRCVAQTKDIGQAIKQAFAPCSTKFPQSRVDAHRMIPVLIESVARFKDLPWFSRVWTTQEYTFAKQAIFLCEFEVLEASLVHRAARTIEAHKNLAGSVTSWFDDKIFLNRQNQGEYQPFYEGLLYTCLVELSQELIKIEIGTSRRLGNMIDVSCTQPFDFDSALLRLDLNRPRQSSDPRDKLFAFSNIAPAVFRTFKPDYSLSTVEAYTNFTLNVIRRMGNLDIWHLAMATPHDSLDELSALPSWVIDWTASDSYYTSLQYLSVQNVPSPLPDFRAYGGWRYDACGNHLVVTGREFDLISSITKDDWENRETNARSYDAIDVSMLVYWTKFIGLDMIGSASDKKMPELWNQFWRTLIGDKFPTSSDDYGISLPGRAWLWRQPTRGDEQVVKEFVMEAQKSPIGIPVPRFSKKFRMINDLMWSNVGGRRLFVSRQGSLGICPYWAQVGDLLFHVAGSRWPVILRPIKLPSEEHGMRPTFRFVGVCYIQAANAKGVGYALREAGDVRIV